MSTVGDLDVDRVTFIDRKLATGGSNLAVNAAVTSEQLKHTMGIDIPAMLSRVGAGQAPDASSGSPAANAEWEEVSADQFVAG